MDELTIEDKIYVSSKRAAKLTGYTTDYIGQLCREGRVPARLIGRNWYVLEAAIQDHRFGEQEPKQHDNAIKTPSDNEHKRLSDSWDSPRYEAFPKETTIVNILEQETKKEEKIPQFPIGSAQSAEYTWKEWFDRFDRITIDKPLDDDTAQSAEEEFQTQDELGEHEDGSAEVPLQRRVSVRHIPDDLRPDSKTFSVRDEETQANTKAVFRRSNTESKGRFSTASVLVRTVMLLFASVVAIVALLNSGYIDEYMPSSYRAASLNGVVIYEKTLK